MLEGYHPIESEASFRLALSHPPPLAGEDCLETTNVGHLTCLSSHSEADGFHFSETAALPINPKFKRSRAEA